MHKIIPTLFAISSLAAASAVLAAPPVGDPTAGEGRDGAQWRQRFFDQIDTNHDGVISRAEYQAFVDARFARLDPNGSGVVTAADIVASPATAARVQKRAEGFIKRYDTSGTGQVSKAEFEAREMQRFDKLSGGSGTVTEAQLAARHAHKRGSGAGAAPTPPLGG